MMYLTECQGLLAEVSLYAYPQVYWQCNKAYPSSNDLLHSNDNYQSLLAERVSAYPSSNGRNLC